MYNPAYKPFYWIHNLFKTRDRHFSRKCAGQLICREEMTQICSAYTETCFLFLWPLSIKITLYYIIWILRHYIMLIFHNFIILVFMIFIILHRSSGSYVSPKCPFLAGALTKILNWKASSSTLGSSLCPNQCRRGGRKTASSWLLFIQFKTFL